MPAYGPMGYNGFPYNYNNQNPYMNNQSSYNSTSYNNNLKIFDYVNGVEGAKSYQMQPQQMVPLFDNDNPYIYMKTSNAMGQSTLRYFKLVEITEQEARGQANATQQKDYALKSDFETLSKRIDDIVKKIEKSPKYKENKED